MKVREILGYIQKNLEELENFSDEQRAFSEQLLGELFGDLDMEYLNITRHNLTLISTNIQHKVAYFQGGITNIDSVIDEIKQEIISFQEIQSSEEALGTVPSNSLLAAMYYLVDIIAGSSAMGAGNEETVNPPLDHCNATKSFFESLGEKESGYIAYCRGGKAKDPKKLLPLILDIMETQYALLAKRRVKGYPKKLSAVDLFYKTSAELCMAKGAMYLLRELEKLPPALRKELSGIALQDERVDTLLKQCSEASIASIVAKTAEGSRYKGGHSAQSWLGLRALTRMSKLSTLSDEGAEESNDAVLEQEIASKLRDEACQAWKSLGAMQDSESEQAATIFNGCCEGLLGVSRNYLNALIEIIACIPPEKVFYGLSETPTLLEVKKVVLNLAELKYIDLEQDKRFLDLLDEIESRHSLAALPYRSEAIQPSISGIFKPKPVQPPNERAAAEEEQSVYQPDY